MVLAIALRRQARICAQLADNCEDPHLMDRLKQMASDLRSKADEVEELPSERLRYVQSHPIALAS